MGIRTISPNAIDSQVSIPACLMLLAVLLFAPFRITANTVLEVAAALALNGKTIWYVPITWTFILLL